MLEPARTILIFSTIIALTTGETLAAQRTPSDQPHDLIEAEQALEEPSIITGIRDIDYPPTPREYCRELVYLPHIRLCLTRYLENWQNCDDEYARCRKSTLYSPFYLPNCRLERKECRELTREVNERCLKGAKAALNACWEKFGGDNSDAD